MNKTVTSWYSSRVEQEIKLARWGHYGQPVLIFPTAGGDAEETERWEMIETLAPLIDGGRIKVYSCDSAAGVAFADKAGSIEYRCWLLRQFGDYVAHEVVPAIRQDCSAPDIEVVTAGASIGAFNAVSVTCRFPSLFRAAIGMSGTYDLEQLFDFRANDDYFHAAPICFVPTLKDGEHLDRLRQRFIIFAYGGGRWESPEESWKLAGMLGNKGVPNRVDEWGPQHDHDWPTWREMLPKYLDDLVG